MAMNHINIRCCKKAMKLSLAISISVYTILAVQKFFGNYSLTGNYEYEDSLIKDPTIFQWCIGPVEFWTQEYPNCSALLSGDQHAITQSVNWTPPCIYSDAELSSLSKDCDKFKSTFQFLSTSLSRQEANFPLAFVLVVEKESEQVVRLLSSIYQPQNLYCLTYDDEGSDTFKKSMNSLTKCFHNVLMPKSHRAIEWADFSLLQSTIDCLQILSTHKPTHGWKYVQILSWNDIPLRTNLEMVQLLKLFDGANDVELSNGQAERFRTYYFQGSPNLDMENTTRSIPPDGLIIYKGSFASTLSRQFVLFLLKNPIAQRFLKWSNGTWAPEEQFWSTLIHNIHLNQPGGFPGACLHYYDLEGRSKEWISRYQIWEEQEKSCHGQFLSSSCIFGVGDLANLINQTALVAHKFYRDFQPAAWYCMHEWIFQRTRGRQIDLDMGYYERLPAVRYHRMKDKNQFQC